MLLVPAAASAASAMDIEPGTLPADGSSKATITATFTDADGHPLAGLHVTFSSSDPHNRIGPAKDSGDGSYTAILTASRA